MPVKINGRRKDFFTCGVRFMIFMGMQVDP